MERKGVSPLKIKTKPCNVHCFKEEVKKQYARRGPGWALDDVMCQGYDGHECGREFVESFYAMQKYLKKQLYQGWLLQQCGAVYANWLCVRSAMEYT